MDQNYTESHLTNNLSNGFLCNFGAVGAIECIHSTSCGHGMYTFYTFFYRMYTFYIYICGMCTFYDICNNYTQFFCTNTLQQMNRDVETW